MELEEFRDYFKKKAGAGELKTARELESIIHKKTTSTIQRVTRNMSLELAFAMLICLGAIVLLSFIKGSDILRYMSFMLGAITLLQVIFFIPVYKNIELVMRDYNGNVKRWLENLIQLLDQFINTYVRLMTWLIPLAAIFGGIIGFRAGKSGKSDPVVPAFLDNPSIVTGIIIIIGCTLLFIGTFYYMRWSIRFLYGKYLEELRKSLRELDS
jgi:hypothetical protein